MIEHLENFFDWTFRKTTSKWYLLFNFFIISIVLSGCVYLQYNLMEICRYILFQIFYVLLPGVFLYQFLFRLKGDLIEKITLGYAIGIILTLAEYFVFYSLQFRNGLYFLGPVLSISALSYYIWNRKILQQQLIRKLTDIPVQLLTIYLLLVFAAFMGFVMTLPLPTPGHSFYLDLDILFDIGNTEGLKRGFPLINPRVAGIEFYYQFFTSIHLAVQSYVTDIHPLLITIRYFPFFDMLFLALAVFYVGRKAFGTARYALYFSAIFFFTNSAASIFEFKTSGMVVCNFLFHRLFLLPRGVEVALSFILLLFGLLFDILKTKKICWNLIFLSSLFLAALTGIKGAVSSVFIGSTVLLMFFMLFIKRMTKGYLIYTLFLSFFFTMAYLLLYPSLALNAMVAANASSASTYTNLYFRIGSLLRESFLFRNFDALPFDEIYKSIIYISLIPIYLVAYLPFAMPLFFIEARSYLKNRMRVPLPYMFAAIASILGIVLGLFIQEVGRSNAYFIETSIPFISLIALSWLIKNYHTLTHRYKSLLLASFILSLSTTAVLYFKTVQGATKAIRKPTTFNQTDKRAMVLTFFEYQGLMWLNNNTSSDAVISSDRYFRSKEKTGGASWFYYSAFSNRQFFLEGWAYQRNLKRNQLDEKLRICNLLYEPETQNRGQVMQQNGIDYLIVSDFVHPNLSLPEDGIKLVYQNRDIKIYQEFF
jgi:hypothetical protein